MREREAALKQAAWARALAAEQSDHEKMLVPTAWLLHIHMTCKCGGNRCQYASMRALKRL